MATQANVLSIDVYHFNSTGNAFVRKETMVLPLPPIAIVPCAPGPDGAMRVYSKITTGTPPTDYYVGETIAELNSLIVNS